MANPFKAESDGRHPIIEALITELGSRKGDPLDRLEYLLRNCGYLAERRGDLVVLSDNAHRLDFRDLAPWLPLHPEALETFPWVREFSRRGELQFLDLAGAGTIPPAGSRPQSPGNLPRRVGGLSRQGPIRCGSHHDFVLRRPCRPPDRRPGAWM